MLYQLLSGKVPFEATDGNPMTVAMMHMNDAPKSLSGEIPDVSAAVDKVVAMALEKDPGKRLLPSEFVEKLREAVGLIRARRKKAVEIPPWAPWCSRISPLTREPGRGLAWLSDPGGGGGQPRSRAPAGGCGPVPALCRDAGILQ